MPAPTTLVLLLLLALASQPIHAQAILNPASPASPAPAAPAASPSPAPTSPSPPPAEANPPAPPEPSQSSTTNAAPAAPTSSPVPANNSPASSSVQSANSQTNSVASQSSASSLASRPSSTSSTAPQTISGGLSQPASSIVIVTLTRTGADGQIYTSLTSTYSPLARPSSTPNNNGSASGSSSNTWAIIGGIVGGLAGIAAVVFIVFRCTQRRFSDLDDEDVAIKWPELVNRAEDPSTLNPLAARPGVGHGIGEDDDQTDEKPRLYSHDIAMESLHSDQRHPGMYDSYQAYPPPPPLHPQEHNGYYDPYLGPSAAQQPYPGTLNNLGYDDQPGYQHRPHDLHSQPSLGSSVGNTHDPQGPPRPDSRQQQQQQQQQLGHLNLSDHHLQYPIAWDGPEDIPLTVVNNNSHHQQQQQQQPSANSAPLHNPYHPS
ncbi:hypothetical protein, variant [Puccinia triticina 1-1 BBBD Race 1]|uniref:Mid2 domain-containing protein n=1 Tax=Puccinia triticina (isolate 1-1 / race 1 (BBBD)) TaxID=630390 RepID=A0A180GP70_PUCT1|nr:hypothetical protein, variant [Puccinia triticina 1-1 BBBD Race 1]